MKRIPDTLVIVFFILCAMVLLTWIWPAGIFDVVKNSSGRDIVVSGSYHRVDASPVGLMGLLEAPFKGFVEAAKIIAFVLIVGGAFGWVMDSGAIDAGLVKLMSTLEGTKAGNSTVLIVLMVMFSICGFTFGMSEESLVFVLLTIPLALRMGYDVLVGVAIPFVTSGLGGAAAAYNPFSVGVAMEIAGIPFPSGVLERFIFWIVLTAVTIVFVLNYAKKISLNPERSLMHGIAVPDSFQSTHMEPWNAQRMLVILLFLFTLILIPLGAMYLDWGVIQIGAVFFALGIVSAMIMGFSMERAVKSFTNGVSGMLTAALVIALSRSVLVVARDGQIIDTILNGLVSVLDGLPRVLCLEIMFVVQGIINFFIPSGSGQAAITMPIMAPLGDLLGISANQTVMAFQLAAGYFDLIIPTSGVTMGVLSIAGIPYKIWLRWMRNLMFIAVLIAFVGLALMLIFNL
ncbi:MAG: YfcC family protein [Flavobacteriales bacterium]